MPENVPEFPELNEPGPITPSATPKRSIVLIAGAALVLAMFGFGLLTLFVPAPPVPAGILTATAGGDGPGGYQQVGQITGDPLLAASATGLESRRNVSASSHVSNSNGDRLFDRTLAIFNRDDDLLMQRVGLALFETLRDTGRFEQVRYLPATERLPDGERLPEIFVTLDKTAWKQSGLPGRREYEGNFVVTLSDRYLRSSHSYQSTLSPPQIDFRWQAEIDYTATQTGIETSGARYQAVSRDLATEIAGQLVKFLDDTAGKYGAAVPVPERFYPAYAPPQEFDFVSELGAEKLIDGRAFMRPTITMWQTPDERIPREVVALVGDALEGAGWKVPQNEQEGDYLRATSGEQVLVVFRQNDGRGLAGRDADAKERVFIVYTRSMPASDMAAGVQQMLADGTDESALVMFQRYWYQHRDAVEEYFAQHAPTDAASWLQLARLRQKSDPDGASEALLRANALRWIFHQSPPDSSMKELAEELGIEELPRDISPEMIESLGVARLDTAGEQTLTAHTNAKVVIWLGEEDGKQTWLLLTLRPRGARSGLSLQINQVAMGDGSWSRSEQTATKTDPSTVWEHKYSLGPGDLIEIACEPAEEESSSRLIVRRTAPVGPQ